MEETSPGQALAFGPIPSRRLGLSVGVNVVPRKVCSFNCVYCQLGRTTRLTLERREHIPTDAVVEAVEEKLGEAERTDFVTVLGDGEPTLASNLADIRERISDVWEGRTALLTNGSTLWMEDVRDAAAAFDVVMPTVSACDQGTFRRLHRPHGSLSFERCLGGIMEFADRHRAKTWVEVMLVKGLNDDARTIEGIAEIVREMRPAEVHLMAPTRPPSASWVGPPDREAVALALERIPYSVDFTRPEHTEMPASDADAVRHLVEISGTHPLRHGQAVSVLRNAGYTDKEAGEAIAALVTCSALTALERDGEMFYVRGPSPPPDPQHV